MTSRCSRLARRRSDLRAAIVRPRPEPRSRQRHRDRTQTANRSSGVVVAVQGLGLSVATTATGRYVLTHVPARHAASCSSASSATRTTRADRHRHGGGHPPPPMRCSSPDRSSWATVVVEGVSRAPDRMIDAPAAVDVVQPATGEPMSITGQLPLALARVPGLDVAQSGVTDFNVNARGFNTLVSRKMLVLAGRARSGHRVGGVNRSGEPCRSPSRTSGGSK